MRGNLGERNVHKHILESVMKYFVRLTNMPKAEKNTNCGSLQRMVSIIGRVLSQAFVSIVMEKNP